ncbi:MAG: CRTAC1 family protein, partial [Candidatus Latescibacterota bacterium]|nr:CRTAC1 family protein [Candidatus Latescibacterota bacterium]
KSKSDNRLLFSPGEKRTSCSPRRYNGAPDVLYITDGAGGFEDRTRDRGVFSAYGKGLGVLVADFDRDGDSDVFVANDGMRNFFYRNTADGKFIEEALEVGLAYNGEGQPEAGMGIAAADYDYDMDVDLLVTNFSRETNTLYENIGDARFLDRSRNLGLHEGTWLPLGFGTFFFDADNDTDLDLFFANGHVLDRIAMQDSTLTYEQANQIFFKEGDRYTDRTQDSGMMHPNLGVSRGAAAGDFDNDGDLDLLVNDIDGPAKLYRNLTKNNHWLMLELVGTKSNRDGIGTELRLKCGEQIQTRWHLGGGSYLSVGDPRIHFGLGDCSNLESLEIKWPSGSNQILTGIKADQLVRIVEND